MNGQVLEFRNDSENGTSIENLHLELRLTDPNGNVRCLKYVEVPWTANNEPQDELG